MNYHPFANYLLAIKSDNLVQVWDCAELVEKAKTYNHADLEKCKKDFVTLSKPMKEYEFEDQGKKPSPTCCSWLPTDSNKFAVGYSSGHVVVFDFKTGKVES